MNNRVRRAILLAGTALAGLAIVEPGLAQTTWTSGASDNNWFTPGNWTAGTPNAATTANVTSAGTAGAAVNIATGLAAAAGALNIDSGNNVFVSNGSLAITDLLSVGQTGAGTSSFSVSSLGGAASASALRAVIGAGGQLGNLNVNNGG